MFNVVQNQNYDNPFTDLTRRYFMDASLSRQMWVHVDFRPIFRKPVLIFFLEYTFGSGHMVPSFQVLDVIYFYSFFFTHTLYQSNQQTWNQNPKALTFLIYNDDL